MAEGRSAVHAPRRLPPELALIAGQVKFPPVFEALERGNLRRELARVFHESSGFSHERQD